MKYAPASCRATPHQVPEKAVQQKRGHGVRVLVLSRNLVRPNDFLGQADVPLSLLQVSEMETPEFCSAPTVFLFVAEVTGNHSPLCTCII